MPNPQIEALDNEIQQLEKSIDQNSGNAKINQVNEAIYSKKMEMQRLLSLQMTELPADAREQLDRLTQDIDTLEKEVQSVTDSFVRAGGDSQAKFARLTAMKLEKQSLLSRLPRLTGSEVVL